MKQALTIFTALLILTSCTDKREEMLAKERKEMQLLLENNTAVLYKGIKLSLCSAASANDPASHIKDEATRSMKLQAVTVGVLRNMIDDSLPAPGVTDYAAAATELYSIKKAVSEASEEELPTLYENILFISNGTKPSGNINGPKWYNKSTEHLLLAVLWMGSRTAPKEFGVYEAAAADPEKIDDPMLKLATEMTRALIFFDQKWNYLAEDECTNYLNNLEKTGPSIGNEFAYSIFPEATVNTPESKYHQLHAAGLLMRGLCRHSSEREDEALEDYENFLQDMGHAGVSNESVWLIGTYVSLKQEKNDEALKYIAQLEQSKVLGEEEKELLQNARTYISNRGPAKALNSISDKLFITKITSHYAWSMVEKTEGYKQLQQNETGKMVLEVPKYIGQGYELMTSPVKSIIDLDSVGTKAKDFVKDLFN